jgi:hypothetical protein
MPEATAPAIVEPDKNIAEGPGFDANSMNFTSCRVEQRRARSE